MKVNLQGLYTIPGKKQQPYTYLAMLVATFIGHRIKRGLYKIWGKPAVLSRQYIKLVKECLILASSVTEIGKTCLRVSMHCNSVNNSKKNQLYSCLREQALYFHLFGFLCNIRSNFTQKKFNFWNLWWIQSNVRSQPIVAVSPVYTIDAIE